MGRVVVSNALALTGQGRERHQQGLFPRPRTGFGREEHGGLGAQLQGFGEGPESVVLRGCFLDIGERASAVRSREACAILYPSNRNEAIVV